MTELPSVSARCITYRRLSLLDESVGYFLRQTYLGPKEMVILNDFPGTKIICDCPEVQVFNWNHKFESVGAKINKAVSLCKGEIIFPWADDDLYEPWTLATVVSKMGGMPCISWQPFYKDSSSVTLRREPTTGMLAIRKDFWNELGGIPNGENPAGYIHKCISSNPSQYKVVQLTDKEIFYRWRPSYKRKFYNHKFDQGPQPATYHIKAYE